MSADREAPRSDRPSHARLEQGAVSDASITEIHQQLLREKPEPTEGFSPIPIFLLFVFSGLIFYAGIYLSKMSGDFEPLAFNPGQGRAPSGDAAAPVQVDPMVLGARLYAQNCVACHQPTGMGLPGVFPPLGGSDWVTGSEERLVRVLLHGLTGPIEVNGATYNGLMPAFGPASGYRFNEERIAAVTTYIRASFGNAAGPITTERVREIAAASGGRTAAWTAAELEPFK